MRHIGLVTGDGIPHARCLADGPLELVHRVLQGPVTEIPTVLDEQLIAGAITQAQDRRWHEGEGKAFFQPTDSLVDLGVDLPGTETALVKRFQGKEHHTGVGGVGELQCVQAGKCHGVGHTFGFHGDVGDFLEQLIGTLQGGPFRQFHARHQIELVLDGDEARRHRLEHQPGTRQQQRVYHKHRTAPAQGAGHATLILLGAGVEEAVKGPEQPTKQRVDHTLQPILGGAVRFQQHRRQRRRQGQRIDGGNYRGNGNGHRKLPVELAGNPGEERHGNEHGAQHQTDRNDRARDLLHGLMSRRQRFQAFLDVTLDVLHHHDGVVHHDTDREHQAEQRQGIDGVAQQVQRAEGANDRHWYRQQRDNRRPPRLQEQRDHQYHQQHRLQKGGNDRLDGIADEDRSIVNRLILHPLREAGRQFIHGGDHFVADLQGVGARRLENTQGHRILAIQLRAQGVVTGPHFQPGHVFQAQNLAVVTALEHDVTKLFHGFKSATGVDQCQEVAVRHRFRANLAGRHLYVLLTHGADDIARRQATGRNTVRVQPGAHGVITATEYLRVANTLDPGQPVAHMQPRVITQVERIVGAVR